MHAATPCTSVPDLTTLAGPAARLVETATRTAASANRLPACPSSVRLECHEFLGIVRLPAGGWPCSPFGRPFGWAGVICSFMDTSVAGRRRAVSGDKRVFENRRIGDYQELFVFDATHANALCEEATGFVAQMRRLLSHDQEA